MTTEQAITLIETARQPRDLFAREPTRNYRRLARLTHPDTHPGDHRAAAAFAKLATLWQRHQGGAGVLIATGDIANLYRTRHGVLKLARDQADNDLMDRESAALTQLHVRGDRRYLAYVPGLSETQLQQHPRSGIQRRANVICWLDGFRSLAEVRAAFPGGIDPRDAAWMWRRLLVAVGFAHRAGVIHGAILPEHVMIHPAEHGLTLVDWCYSVSGPAGPLRAIVERYRGWYPPEVLAGQAAGPDLDIWLATRCITHLTGSRITAGLAAFAAGCMLAHPRRRPQDAWRLLAELDEVLESLYGPRTFRPFAMPA